MEVLEFLVWRSRDVAAYRDRLDRMLKLCALPPLLKNASENLRSTLVLQQYFSTLGYLIAALSTDREILIAIEAIGSLLRAGAGPVPACAVKTEIIHQAMEKSELAMIVAKLVEASSPKIYLRVLELAYDLLRISDNCCEHTDHFLIYSFIYLYVYIFIYLCFNGRNPFKKDITASI